MGGKWLAFVLALAVALLVAACRGGGEEADVSPTPLGLAGPCGEAVRALDASPPATMAAGAAVSLTPAGGALEFPSPAAPADFSDVPEGRIAFTSERDGNFEVYVMNTDGSDQTNLTNNPAKDDEPDWSPDGRRIVFVSDRDGNAEIYVMNADGSDVTRLTNHSGGDLSPRWSPDGSKIAFSRDGSICLMDPDGSNLRTVMVAQPEATAEPCRAGSFLGGWSPDSKRITYYAASVSRQIAQVCSINADGSDLRVEFSEPPTYHVEPSWSPDGKKIAFRSIRDDNSEVWVVDLDSGEDRNLTNNPATDIEPDWSPDGEWLVFASYREGPHFDIYIMKADGSNVLRLTDHPAKDSEPAWSPK